MATLSELVSNRTLNRLYVDLKGAEHKRKIYTYPRAESWLLNDVPSLIAFDDGDASPRMQAKILLRNFLRGDPFYEDEEFTLMKPIENDVYELRSPDLRIYGWFRSPGIFIAVLGDTMERTHSVAGLASAYRKEVEDRREALDLDEPKCHVGADPKDVFSV